MSWEALALIEPIFIALVVFGIGFWQLRELNQLRRERDRKHRDSGEAGTTPPSQTDGQGR